MRDYTKHRADMQSYIEIDSMS